MIHLLTLTDCYTRRKRWADLQYPSIPCAAPVALLPRLDGRAGLRGASALAASVRRSESSNFPLGLRGFWRRASSCQRKSSRWIWVSWRRTTSSRSSLPKVTGWAPASGPRGRWLRPPGRVGADAWARPGGAGGKSRPLRPALEALHARPSMRPALGSACLGGPR